MVSSGQRTKHNPTNWRILFTLPIPFICFIMKQQKINANTQFTTPSNGDKSVAQNYVMNNFFKDALLEPAGRPYSLIIYIAFIYDHVFYYSFAAL